MTNLLRDLQYGVRTLLKKPLFASVVIILLALGIGANTAIFTVVNAVLLRPLPYDDPQRIVMITETNASGDQTWVAPADFVDWQQSNSLESIAAMRWWSANLTGGSQPERVQGSLVTPALFDVLGVQPLLGRTFIPDEGREGQDKVVVLSYGLWQRRFGGDPTVIGTTAEFNAIPRVIIGVMPREFTLPLLNIKQAPTQTDAWAPLAPSASYWHARGAHQLRVIGRLKPEAEIAHAQQEMSAVASRISEMYPDSNRQIGAMVTPLHRWFVGDIRPALLLLLFAVGFLLLIACANVANLLLARSAERQNEIAIRSALGASRFRLVQQLLSESLLLALAGGSCGLLLALWGTDTLIALSPQDVPRLQEISIDWNVSLFTLLLSILTGVLFGIIPALQYSRPDLNSSLKEGGRSGFSRKRRLVRSALVVSEIALSLVLLIGAGLMIKSFLRVQAVNPGYTAANVLTMQVSLPGARYPESYQQAQFYRQVIERVSALQGVQAVGATTTPPLVGSNNASSFLIEGRQEKTSSEEMAVVTPDYFRAMGIALLKGRAFSEQDNAEAPPVILVSRALAAAYWPGEDAVGKRIKLEGPEEPWRSIIGVVEDVKLERLEAESIREYYLPYSQDPWNLSSTMTFVVRTDGGPLDIAGAVRDEVRAVDKDLPVYNVKSMDEIYEMAMAGRRFNTLLLGVFAAIALILSAVGIYGTISYSVTQRTREIGIRMAMGAQASDVLKMVMRQGMKLIAIGLSAGLASSLALTRLMESLLFGVDAIDPSAFALVSIVLAAVAAAACYVPARRASRVEPLTALRHD